MEKVYLGRRTIGKVMMSVTNTAHTYPGDWKTSPPPQNMGGLARLELNQDQDQDQGHVSRGELFLLGTLSFFEDRERRSGGLAHTVLS